MEIWAFSAKESFNQRANVEYRFARKFAIDPFDAAIRAWPGGGSSGVDFSHHFLPASPAKNLRNMGA
jgi:hypothetical protein